MPYKFPFHLMSCHNVKKYKVGNQNRNCNFLPPVWKNQTICNRNLQPNGLQEAKLQQQCRPMWERSCGQEICSCCKYAVDGGLAQRIPGRLLITSGNGEKNIGGNAISWRGRIGNVSHHNCCRHWSCRTFWHHPVIFCCTKPSDAAHSKPREPVEETSEPKPEENTLSRTKHGKSKIKFPSSHAQNPTWELVKKKKIQHSLEPQGSKKDKFRSKTDQSREAVISSASMRQKLKSIPENEGFHDEASIDEERVEGRWQKKEGKKNQKFDVKQSGGIEGSSPGKKPRNLQSGSRIKLRKDKDVGALDLNKLNIEQSDEMSSSSNSASVQEKPIESSSSIQNRNDATTTSAFDALDHEENPAMALLETCMELLIATTKAADLFGRTIECIHYMSEIDIGMLFQMLINLSLFSNIIESWSILKVHLNFHDQNNPKHDLILLMSKNLVHLSRVVSSTDIISKVLSNLTLISALVSDKGFIKDMANDLGYLTHFKDINKVSSAKPNNQIAKNILLLSSVEKHLEMIEYGKELLSQTLSNATLLRNITAKMKALKAFSKNQKALNTVSKLKYFKNTLDPDIRLKLKMRELKDKYYVPRIKEHISKNVPQPYDMLPLKIDSNLDKPWQLSFNTASNNNATFLPRERFSYSHPNSALPWGDPEFLRSHHYLSPLTRAFLGQPRTSPNSTFLKPPQTSALYPKRYKLSDSVYKDTKLFPEELRQDPEIYLNVMRRRRDADFEYFLLSQKSEYHNPFRLISSPTKIEDDLISIKN